MYYLAYGFFYLISLLPFWFLYALSDLLYFLVYHLIGYRKKIVMNNLEIAFPEKSKMEKIKIAKKFYHNFLDNFVETIKLLSINEKKFLQRCTGNVDEINNLIARGRSIQLHGAHQFNWEFANFFYPKKLTLPMVGIYMPINNNIVNKIFLKLRTLSKTVLIDAKKMIKMHTVYKPPFIIAFICDQNPGATSKSFWLNFFGKTVPFLRPPERSAVRNNAAVFFGKTTRLKRGHYLFETILAKENAAETKPGELTLLFRDFLEDCIRQQPENYLWTHRRWKHEYKPIYKNLLID